MIKDLYGKEQSDGCSLLTAKLGREVMIKLNDKVSIGHVLMAPLAGVTDRTFRGIITEMGADLTYTEMVSAKALHYQNEATRQLLRLADNQKFIAVQLFGEDADILAETAASFEELPQILLIDINMGCPAPKIVKNGEGSALMKDPAKAAGIIKAVKRRTTKPVTCKFRRGFGMGDETALDFAKAMEAAGADLITVHGRYREQYYTGDSDREIIRRIKNGVSIPVIGNGDIFTGAAAKQMFEETGCDGIMVARGALGNPYIFREIKAYLKHEPYLPPTNEERIDLAITHLRGAVEDMGEYTGVREMRKHMGWYLKGLHSAARHKDQINHAQTLDEVIGILEDLKAANPADN